MIQNIKVDGTKNQQQQRLQQEILEWWTER